MPWKFPNMLKKVNLYEQSENIVVKVLDVI
jgi:hypothetical protein